MEIEVLVSTMHQKDLSIAEKMNIKGNAIIINQCDVNDFNEINENGRWIKMYSFNERGVGLSRNNALMRAAGDICILADDDVVYSDEYETLILDAFRKHPNADVLIFNVPSADQSNRKGPAEIKKNAPVHYFNFMRYGAYNIAFKKEKVVRANIFFSLLFGGGAKYSSGEDTLFLFECLKKGLKVYTNTAQIGTVNHKDSTWFKGYNQKYFIDKGIFFATLSRKLSYLLILQFAIRKHKLFKHETRMIQAIKYMIQGRRIFLVQ